jgi:hypothetical protein
MTAWEYAMWGFFGGLAVEGLEFGRAIRRVGGWPWHQPGEPGPLPLAVSVLIRLVVSALVTWAAGSTHQVSGPFGALAVGVAAPLVIEQLAQVPLASTPGMTATPALTSEPSTSVLVPDHVQRQSGQVPDGEK